jgi:predicted GIY-YIG superfamily endonuclease
MAWVYILRGSCGRYYIGSTANLDRRLAEHRRGKVHSTRRFGEPLELII